MRTLSWSLVLSTLWACSGDDTPPPVDSHTGTVTDTETDPDPLLDSSWPVGDIGNLHLAHHVNTGRTEVFGLFLDGSAGFLNMAQCTLIDSIPCVGGLPGEEDFEDIDRDQELDPDVVDSRFLGFEIEFAGFTLPYVENPRDGFGYYAFDASPFELPEGKVGATWGGQWERRRSRDDLVISPPIELISPRVGGNVFVVNGTRLPIEWVPTGSGEVTVTVSNRFTTYRLYHVADDGYFELDVDALGLFGNLEELTVTVTRWDIAEVEWTGHYVRMVASSDAFFTMDLANVGSRDPLYVVDSCAEASGMPPLASGDYWGRLDGFDANLNPALFFPNCLTETYNFYANARGRDGLVKVDLPPKSIINLEYTHFSESAAVYFLRSCTSANSCEAGIDADISPGSPEVLSLFNKTDELESYTLVVDGTEDDSDSSEVFTLDVTVEELIDPEMFDFCSDSQNATPTLTTAGYYEEFVAYTGDLNPGLGGCTGTSLPGPEAMMPFTLQPGQTVTVTLDMEGGNGALYVLSGCDAFSCVGGSDVSLSGPEQIVLTNTGAAAADLHLVVDSVSGLRPFVLGVTFQ